MGNYVEMMRFYRQFQDARIKPDQKRRNLDKLEAVLLAATDSETLEAVIAQREAAQAEYETAKAEAEEAWYLSTTGRGKSEATAPMVFRDMVGMKWY